MSSLRGVAAMAAFSALLLLPQQGMADELSNKTLSTPTIGDMPIEQPIALLSVTLDYAKILKFDRQARTIIIGNPGIVDGTMSDPSTIVLTGKAVGTTNVIVLDMAGQEISNFAVQVARSNKQLTVVHHGAAQQAFSCIGSCIALGSTIAGKQTSASPEAPTQ